MLFNFYYHLAINFSNKCPIYLCLSILAWVLQLGESIYVKECANVSGSHGIFSFNAIAYIIDNLSPNRVLVVNDEIFKDL